MEAIKLKEKYCEFPKINNGEPPYIGLKIEKKNNQKFHFIFPVNYYTENEYAKISEKQLKNDIKNLLKAIYKANVSEIYSNNKSKEKVCPIDNYIWIINNYIQSGYYIEQEIIYAKKNNGKINWKKTIKNNEYLIDNDLNIIYNKFITKQAITNETNIITLIHKYCVYVAVKTFWFLCNINENSVEEPSINMKVEEMLAILRAEYTKSFLDSKKELLINMIQMLEWLFDEKTSYDMFSINESKFQVVFENLIYDNFGNEENLEEYYPFANWYIKGENEPFKSSYLREDAILKNKDTIYILDAKYYKYAYIKEPRGADKLPNTASIEKQIIYGEYVAKTKKKKTYNIFLIPFNGSKNNFIEYIGYAKESWKDTTKTNKEELYEKIYTFKVDLKSLVNGTFTKEENIKKLLNSVQNVIEE